MEEQPASIIAHCPELDKPEIAPYLEHGFLRLSKNAGIAVIRQDLNRGLLMQCITERGKRHFSAFDKAHVVRDNDCMATLRLPTEQNSRMTLEATHPGTAVEQVHRESGKW